MHAYRCHLSCLRNWNSVLVDTLNDDRSKVTVSVRTEHHLLLKLDNTPQNSTTQNETNAPAEETRVNDELRSNLSLHWKLGTLVHERLYILILLWQYAKEVPKLVSARGLQVRH